MGRHDSLLFPSKRQEYHNYSALAQFSSLTLQEHEETIQKLNKQKEAIVRACSALAEQEAEDNRRHKIVMNELAAEEASVLERLANAKKMIESLEISEGDERMETNAELQRIQVDREALTLEEEELIELESKLKSMDANYKEKIEELNEQKRLASYEYESGMSLLERTRQAARMASSSVSKFGAGAASVSILSSTPLPSRREVPSVVASPQGVSGSGYSYSSPGRRQQPPVESRHVTPPRSRGATPPPGPRTINTSVNTSSTHHDAYNTRAVVSPAQAGRNMGTWRSREGLRPDEQVELREAVREHSNPHSTIAAPRPPSTQMSVDIPPKSFIDRVRSSPPRDERTASSPSKSTVGPAGRSNLHIACSSTHRDVDNILALLKAEPDLVNALDDAGNIPLHCACSADQPSLEVVHALLLAGSSTTVKNNDGYTPFHLACLNTADRDHKLKKFLIFKGAQNPNQRTAKGETAAHLCAAHDRHFESLRYLSTVGVDLDVTAVLPAPEADQPARRMSPLEVARANGRSASKCRAFLEAHHSNTK